MHEFVGRQSALPLKGSYLTARKMIYLLILWLVQEIKKSRRAGSREQTFPSSPGILNSKDQGRDFSPRQEEKHSSSHDSAAEDLSLRIHRDCLSIHHCGGSVAHWFWHRNYPLSLSRPTYISQSAPENGQSFQWLLFQDLFQKGRFPKGFTSQTWVDVLVR